MPYITDERRNNVDPMEPQTPGELNYLITQTLLNYLAYKGTNYTFLNDCLGALSGATLEFYRRVVVPYEEQKLTENGDVY